MSKHVDNHMKTGGEHLEFKNKVGIILELSPACNNVFQEMKLRRKHRYIIFKIDNDLIEVESTGPRNSTYDDLKKALPFTDSRYLVFDHEFKTPDGRPTSKLWFISWLPVNSTPYNKMAYTSCKAKLRDALPGVFDAQAANIDELDTVMGMKAEEDDDEDFDF